jgi:hypothetical protein
MKNKSIPWQRQRRLLQVVTGTCHRYSLVDSRYTSTDKGERRRARCVRRRMRSAEAAGKESCQRSGDNWPHPERGCEVDIAAHNACIRELLQEVNAHGKADRHMRPFTIETQSRCVFVTAGPITSRLGQGEGKRSRGKLELSFSEGSRA